MATDNTAGFEFTLKQSAPLGAALGAMTFLFNYLAIFIFLIIDGIPPLNTALWKQTMWYFFNAHNVAIQDSQGSVNFLANPDAVPGLTSTIPGFMYYALPVIVLAVAGYYMYTTLNADLGSAGLPAIGATLAISYGVLCLLGAVLSSATVSGVNVSVSLPMALLLAGILYPVIFGTVGAVIARETN